MSTKSRRKSRSTATKPLIIIILLAIVVIAAMVLIFKPGDSNPGIKNRKEAYRLTKTGLYSLLTALPTKSF